MERVAACPFPHNQTMQTRSSIKPEGAESGDLIDWRDKQLAQDIEKRAADPQTLTLDDLSEWDPSVCGTSKTKSKREDRKHWSDKIQVSFLQWCVVLLF
jgi:hypothetical protein